MPGNIKTLNKNVTSKHFGKLKPLSKFQRIFREFLCVLSVILTKSAVAETILTFTKKRCLVQIKMLFYCIDAYLSDKTQKNHFLAHEKVTVEQLINILTLFVL